MAQLSETQDLSRNGTNARRSVPKREATWRSGLLLLALAALVGCATVPKQQFDHKASAGIRKIAILQVDELPAYEVRTDGAGAATMGLFFGLIGGLVAAAAEESHSSVMTAKFMGTFQSKSPPNVSGQLLASVTEALSKAGYEVEGVARATAKKGELEQDYSKIQTDADAILDLVVVRAGYIIGSAGSGYQPRMLVNARLVSAQQGKQLYSQSFSYGSKSAFPSEPSLLANEKYRYPSFEALLAGSNEAVLALVEGAGSIGELISRDLSKSN